MALVNQKSVAELPEDWSEILSNSRTKAPKKENEEDLGVDNYDGSLTVVPFINLKICILWPCRQKPLWLIFIGLFLLEFLSHTFGLVLVKDLIKMFSFIHFFVT